MNLSTQVEYDELARASKVTSAEGVVTQTNYNSQSQIVVIQRYPRAFNNTGQAAAMAAPRWQDNCLIAPYDCNTGAYPTRKAAELREKVAILNAKLSELGLGAIPPHSAALARSNRTRYLSPLRHGGDPTTDMYRGILLPGD